MCAEYWRARRRSAGQYPRTFLCVIISFMLIATQLVYPWSITNSGHGIVIVKSEAKAVAPILAGAGVVLKEIAIQAGLSIGAVAVTDAVLSTTATGKSVYDEPVSYGSYAGELPPAAPNRPNWPLWENMTAEQKAAWGNSETEYKNAYTAVCTSKVLGIEDYYDDLRTWQANGGAEADKPQPDAATKEKLQKFGQAGKQWAKGGAVAMGTVGGMIAFDSLLDFLFGTSQESLGYPTNFNIVSGNGRTLPFVSMPYIAVGDYTSNNAVCFLNDHSGPTEYVWRSIEDPNHVVGIAGDNRAWIPGISYQVVYYPNYTNVDFGETNAPFQIGTGQYEYSLNAAFPGGYELPDGGTFINGQVINGTENIDSQYDPIEDTPSEITTSVGNTQNVINNFTDISITQDPETGKYPSIVVPSDGIDPETTKYPDLITDGATTPDEDIDTGEEPDNPDNPENPTEEDFGEGLRERLIRLFEAPVKNVFPFCLMIDIRDYLSQMTEQFGYDSLGNDDEALPNAYQVDRNGGISLQAVGDGGGGGARDDEPSSGGTGGGGGARPPENDPRFTQITIPITAFSDYIEEDIVLDFAPLRELFLITRPFFTYFVFLGLVFGCLRFYLYRGGE